MASNTLSFELKPFDEMTDEEARLFLSDFLDTENKILDETIRIKHSRDEDFEVGRDWLVSYFEEFDPVVRPKYRDWGDRLPDFLKELPEHSKGEPYFDENARMCLLRMGYYFGECLVREFPNLYWGIGNREYSDSGMPVIAGFPKKQECPPIHVCGIACQRIDRLNLNFDEFLETLDVWREKLGNK